MTERSSPALTRACADCGVPDGMALRNVAGTVPRNIPLLYVCQKCGAMLTIPPRVVLWNREPGE
jgi:hypothetical protein